MSLKRWQARLTSIGAKTCLTTPERLARDADLRGAVVVAFCNVPFLAAAERFRGLGCRVVWVGCMNWLFPTERLHYRRCGVLERYVFQSRYQRAQLEPQLRKFGYRDAQGRLIRGAFDCTEFPFQPRQRRAGEQFVVGRLSRPAAEKFHPDTWNIYGGIPQVRARVMGWNAAVQRRLGPPPDWAEVLAPCSQSSREFLASLHALVMVGGTALENWPRVGLEAMAAGVPIVTDRCGGWLEMIRHGETGCLARNAREMTQYAACLAGNEERRREMARAARSAVESLSDPELPWGQWRELLDGLQ
jgi:glycosyltransferase involved in cell wall biosynthesis